MTESRRSSIYTDALDSPMEEDSLEHAPHSNPPHHPHAHSAVSRVSPRTESEDDPVEQVVDVDDGDLAEDDDDNDIEDEGEGEQVADGTEQEVVAEVEARRSRTQDSHGSDQDMEMDIEVEDDQRGRRAMQVDTIAGQTSTGSRTGSSVSAGPGSGSGSPHTSASTPPSTTEPPATSSSSVPLGRAIPVPVVDEKAQSELRRKIMDIQRDSTISFADKAGMIQKLMSSKWQGSQRTSDGQKDDSVEASEEDLKTTYYNAEQEQLGCKHYRRGCKLKANCCGQWFNCRFCHDDVCDHAIVRSDTKTMLCMHCKAIQPAAQSCSSCNARMAAYFCDVCKLWDDDPRKHIYHCDDCGICRIGQGLGRDYFHCKKCNVCMNIQLQGKHKCIERNLECDCPICGEYMFTSTATVIFMPCGHCIHNKCHEDYIKTSYQCPTCWKALGDMTVYYSKIDSLLAEQTMPPEYANIFSIVLCNDCEVKSEAPYHFLYHKCDKCKGYNTKVLETFKRVSDGQVEVVENATAAGASGAAPENNLSGGTLAGSSSSTPTMTTAGGNATGVNLVHVAVPRSPLMDQNASGDMTMAGISGNSAP